MKKLYYKVKAIRKTDGGLYESKGSYDSFKEACCAGCPSSGTAFDVAIHEFNESDELLRGWKIVQEF